MTRSRPGRARPVVVVTVPGLTGGVDEAVRHLFGAGPLQDRLRIRMLVTRGRRAWAAPPTFAWALVRLAWWRARGRIDLVHLNVSWKGSTLRQVVLAALARRIGLPYVVQLHSGGFHDFHGRLHRRLQPAVRSLFTGADHVLVLGRPFRDLVIELFDLPPASVSIVPNAVRLPEPRTDSERSPDRPLILFTGRLWAAKGVDELLEALALIDHLPWSAVLAGDGEVERLRAEAAALGLADRVTIRDWQSRAAVEDLLASASIFAHPSHNEALSVSLLEAMAAGLCCVATEVGAHGDILVDGENALVVEPGDAGLLADRLAKAVTDPRLRSRLGRQARRTIETSCSVTGVGARLIWCYQRVLAEP